MEPQEVAAKTVAKKAISGDSGNTHCSLTFPLVNQLPNMDRDLYLL